MLNSCGLALSQGDESDFHPRCNWEQLPLVTAPAWELGEDWLHAMGPHLLRLTLAAQKNWKNTGLLAGVADCGRRGKWGYRGRMVRGFKPMRSSHTVEREHHAAWGEKRENHLALAEWGPCGGNTAGGAGSPNHGLLLFFLRYGTQDWAEGKGRTVCICGYSKGL